MLKMQKIGSVLTVSSGGTPNRKREDYYSGGTIPWVKTGDLKGKFIEEPNEYITSKGLQNSSAKLFPKNTVLVAMYGATIGACSILPIEAATNQACAALLPCPECDPAYLYYHFSSIKNDLIKKGVGGAQPNISLGILKNLEIPLPPLEEQKTIAAILDAADDCKHKTKALIEKYDQLTQSLFLDMFGDPVTNPKGWETQKLKSNVSVLSGFAFTSNLFNDEEQGMPIIRIRDVGKLKTNTYFSGNYKREFMVDNGDLIIGMDGDFRLAEWSGGNALLNQRVCKIKSIGGYMDDVFLKYWLPVELKRIEDRTSFATVKHLSVKSIHDIDMPVIPEYHRIIFKDRVATLEKQKQQAEASLVKAEELFNSLLQRAFKGELTN